MMASSILTLGRHTVSGMIAASGRQFSDWSATYRLFERERIDTDCLFAPALDGALKLQGGDCVYAVMDDTMIRKAGKNGACSYFRTPPIGIAPLHQAALLMVADTGLMCMSNSSTGVLPSSVEWGR